MPTPTYTPLATVTLGTATSTVTFSSIPATYRDLILVINGTVSSSGAVRIRFNSDSGSNYPVVVMYADSSGPQSVTATASFIDGGVFASSESNYSINQIMDYSATDKHKTVLTRSGRNSVIANAGAERWANTAAITTVEVSHSASYNTATTFNLYGVIS
jgi:hypothetical protein